MRQYCYAMRQYIYGNGQYGYAMRLYVNPGMQKGRPRVEGAAFL